MASQWADTMRESGQVKDFVAVGDVDIKVIGADNQALDTQVPVRQMLEQIVAKLGLPPFILGLSWSTTERMSAAAVGNFGKRAGKLPRTADTGDPAHLQVSSGADGDWAERCR